MFIKFFIGIKRKSGHYYVYDASDLICMYTTTIIHIPLF